MSGFDAQENLEIIQEFVQDCRDLLEDLELAVLDMSKHIEAGESNPELINKIFRTFHSIKGGAGFLMLNNIKEVAHNAENLLDLVRGGRLELTQQHIDLFVKSSDFIKEAIEIVLEKLADDEKSKQAEKLIKELRKSAKNAAEKTEFEPKAEELPEVMTQSTGSGGIDFHATPEMVAQFSAESMETFRQIEELLLVCSENEQKRETLDHIFRLIHSFKGNCGFLGFKDLQKLAHRMESMIDAAITGAVKNCQSMTKVFLTLVDVIEAALVEIRDGGDGTIERLELYLELMEDMLPKGYIDGSADGTPRIGEILLQRGVITEDAIEKALEVQRRPIGEILVDMGAIEKEDIDQALNEQEKNRPEVTVEARPSAVTKIAEKRQDLRVDVQKLDSLLNLIGELVIAHNMVLHNPDIENLDLPNFSKAVSQMGKIVRELRDTAMTVRMIPVAGLFKRMIRLVHDLSSKSGKKVELVIAGEETEIDKTVVELVTDPLVHIIRNALDHGLESIDDRKLCGKPDKGTLKLTAKHEEGEVWIIIEDDGRGINKQKVLKKAIEKGLVQGDGSHLTEREIFELIFLPGFSTADRITDISGRGVGMDVVKKNLEKIKGRIEIDSKEGRGSRFTLRIPLTLAIIEGMLVRVGSSHYIIPLLSIKEFFKIEQSKVTVSPDGGETVRLRDRLLDVIRLHELHSLNPDSPMLDNGILIVIESHDNLAALFVDEIVGQQQTVIKGLSEYIGKVRGVSGCTILGDGGISLILDIDAIFNLQQAGA